MYLESKFNEVCSYLTANEWNLASRIYRNKQSICSMNSTRLAQHLNISRTILIRF